MTSLVRLRGRLTIIVGAALVVGAGTYALSVLHVSDPTEGGRAVEVINDGSVPARISLCADQWCHHIADAGAIVRPGDFLRQRVQADSVNPFAVEVPPGASPTCEALRVGTSIAPRYFLSQMVPCDQ